MRGDIPSHSAPTRKFVDPGHLVLHVMALQAALLIVFKADKCAGVVGQWVKVVAVVV